MPDFESLPSFPTLPGETTGSENTGGKAPNTPPPAPRAPNKTADKKWEPNKADCESLRIQYAKFIDAKLGTQFANANDAAIAGSILCGSDDECTTG